MEQCVIDSLIIQLVTSLVYSSAIQYNISDWEVTA